MIAFIDENRDEYGVEPICRTLPIAPSIYHAHDARRRHPDEAPPRVVRDLALKPEVERVFYENFQVYGVRKVWRQLKRDGFDVASLHGGQADEKHGTEGRYSRQAASHHL